MPPIADEYLSKTHTINPEWKEYYMTLEVIRRSGICNMWGASPYLAEFTGIDHKLAKEVLCSWIKNYSELKNLYWPDSEIYLKLKEE